jgi:hypothetical protein
LVRNVGSTNFARNSAHIEREYESMLNGNVGAFHGGFKEMEKVNQDVVIVAHVPNPMIKGAPTFFCNSVCFYQTCCARPEAIFI